MMFFIRSLFYRFWKNIADSFKGRSLICHFIAIAGTYIIVVSGFDRDYFQFFKGSGLYYALFSAAGVGALVPVITPVVLLVLGKIEKNFSFLNTGFALGQAIILGEIISSFYKALTGRAHPDMSLMSDIDLTQVFNFGFMRGGVFWGWPSSHTTVAFAIAFTLWVMYPKNKTVKALAFIYALYTGLGVSMTIHWFSDFFAGAIIGIVIGTVVGKAFKAREQVAVQ